MDVSIIKFPFKEGKREEWISWCEEIMDRKKEAMQTLEREGVVLEGMFVDDSFAYILMVAKDQDEAVATTDEDPQPIDVTHRQKMQECLITEEYQYLDQLVDLQRLS